MILVLQAPIHMHVAAFSNFGSSKPSCTHRRRRARRLILAGDGLRCEGRGGRHRLTPLAYPHTSFAVLSTSDNKTKKPVQQKDGGEEVEMARREWEMHEVGYYWREREERRRGVGKSLVIIFVALFSVPFKLAPKENGSPRRRSCFRGIRPHWCAISSSLRHGTPGRQVSSSRISSSPFTCTCSHPVNFDAAGKMPPHLHR